MFAAMLSFCCLEWHRVLKPGGTIMVSVPDLRTLARYLKFYTCTNHCTIAHLYFAYRMYLDESLNIHDRWKVTNMIYGGQTDEYDYHKVIA